MRGPTEEIRLLWIGERESVTTPLDPTVVAGLLGPTSDATRGGPEGGAKGNRAAGSRSWPSFSTHC